MLRATLESTTDGILVTDGGGNLTDSTRGSCRCGGFRPRRWAWARTRRLLDVEAHDFTDPKRFVERVHEIYALGPPETYDVLNSPTGGSSSGFHVASRSTAAMSDGSGAFATSAATPGRRNGCGHESERFRTTLSSIGDAVVSTDAQGRIDFINRRCRNPDRLARSARRSAGRFRRSSSSVNEATGAASRSPALTALREGRIVALANHTVLVARDGVVRPIDDSAAPIRDAGGNHRGRGAGVS